MKPTTFQFQSCKNKQSAFKLWRRLIRNEVDLLKRERLLKDRIWQTIKHFNYQNETSNHMHIRLLATKRIIDRSIPLWHKPIVDVSNVFDAHILKTFEGVLLFRAVVENMEMNEHNLRICIDAYSAIWTPAIINSSKIETPIRGLLIGIIGGNYLSTANSFKLYDRLQKISQSPGYSVFIEISSMDVFFDVAKEHFSNRCLYTESSLLNFEYSQHLDLLRSVFMSEHEQLLFFDVYSQPRIEFFTKYGKQFFDNFDKLFDEPDSKRQVLSMLWFSCTQFKELLRTDAQQHNTNKSTAYIIYTRTLLLVEKLIAVHCSTELDKMKFLFELSNSDARKAFGIYKYGSNQVFDADNNLSLPSFT